MLKKTLNKIYFLTVVLATLCFSYVKAQNTFSSEDDLKKEAKKLFENEQYAEAYPLYSQLLSVYPKDPNYNYRFGICMLYTSENKEKPISYLEYAAKQPDVEKDVFFFLGKAYHVNYRFDDAISMYNRFKKEASSYQQKKLQVDRQIAMCRSGKTLLKNITDLQVLDKKQVGDNEFFRSYDLTSIGGKLLIKPEDFQSSLDKKAKEKSIIYIPKNNTQIYYSSYGTDGKNGKDIYMVKKMSNGELSPPINLGPTINTDADEDYPFLHPNGKVLYFCSKGHNSMGGYDIFKSTFNEQTGTWGEPVNLDFSINTPDDDIMYVTDSLEKTAYFSSRRASPAGMIDVYKINTERKPVDVAVINGLMAKNAEGQFIKSKITVKNASNGELVGIFNSDPQTGAYTMNVPGGSKLLFTVESEGYMTQSDVVVLPPQTVFKPFKQEITYDDKTDKLSVKNIFDETVDDNTYLQALNFIKEKARMEVNANDAMFKDAPQQNTETPEIKKDTASQKTNTSADISNNALVKIAYDDAEDVQKEAKELKAQADNALAFASLKNQEAQAKYAEADEAAKSGNNDKAVELRKEADKTSRETVAAFNLAKKLDNDASTKQDEADLSTNYAKELDAASKSNSGTALKQLEEEKKRIESLSQKPKGTDNAVSNLKTDADNKEKEVDRAKGKSKDLSKEITDIDAEVKRQNTELSNTKNEMVKEGIRGQIKDLEDDKVLKQKELVENDAKIPVLEKEAANLKNEAELVGGIITQIKTSPETPANVASIDKQKLQEQVNGYQMTRAVVTKNDTVTKTNTASTTNATTSAKENNAAVQTTTSSVQTTTSAKDTSTTKTATEVKTTTAQQNSVVETNKTNSVTQNSTSETAIQQSKTNTVSSGTATGAVKVDTVTTGTQQQKAVDENIVPAASYDKKYSGKLKDANEINDDYTRESTKATYYNTWADSIKVNIESKQKKLKKEKDETKKKELESAITKLESEVKEKQDLAEQSRAKAKAAISGSTIGVSSSADTAKKAIAIQPTLADTIKKTNAAQIVSASDTAKKKVAAQIETKTDTIKKAVLTTAVTETKKDTVMTNKNTVGNSSVSAKDTMKSTTASVVSVKDTSKTVAAVQSSSLVTTIQSKKDTSKTVSATQSSNSGTTATQSNNVVSSTKDTLKSSSSTHQAVTTTVQKDTVKTSAITVTATTNTVKQDTSHEQSTPQIITQQAVNKNAQSVVVKESNPELISAAQSADKAAQDLNAQAMTIRKEAYEKSTAEERDALLQKAKGVEEEAMKKQQESSDAMSQAKSSEYNKANSQLKAYSKTLSKNPSDEVVMADMIKDEANYYFDQAKKSREKAAASTSFTARQDALTAADNAEKTALEKQSKAIGMYLKFQPDTNAVAVTNVKNSSNSQVATTTSVNPETHSAQVANNSGQVGKTGNQNSQASAGNPANVKTNQQEATTQQTSGSTKPVQQQATTQQKTTTTKPVQQNAKQTDVKPTHSTTENNENSASNANAAFLSPQQLREVVDTKEYGDFAAMKSKSDSTMQVARLHYKVADDYRKQAESNNRKAEAIAKIIDTIPAGRPVPDSLTKLMDKFKTESVMNQQKSDSVKAIAKNTEDEANAKMAESELFLHSLDKTLYEHIQLAYNGKVAGNVSTAANSELKGTTQKTNTQQTANSTKSGRNGTTKPANTGKTTSVVVNQLTEGFDISNGTVYSEKNPIPMDVKLPEGLIFKVQIGAFKNLIPQDLFKGMNPLSGETTKPGVIRYTAGLFRDLKPATSAKDRIKGLGYKDAFIVAFFNGKRISFEEAMTKLGNNSSATSDQQANATNVSQKNSGSSNPERNNNAGTNQQSSAASVNENQGTSIAPTTDIATVKGLVYTIQVGVYSKPVTSAQLFNIGSLYTETMNNGFKRYTSGAFTDINEAIKAKDEIVTRGIKDAFITVYKDGKRTTGNDVAPSNKRNTDNNSNATNGVSTGNSDLEVKAKDVTFKIQIGAYKAEVPIDVANKFLSIASKGVKITKDETGMTIYSVGSYKTYEEAEKVKEEVITSGIKDAFVVAYNKTKRMDLETAKKITSK